MTLPDHGALSRYSNQKCRCEKCRAANAAYHRVKQTTPGTRSYEYRRATITARARAARILTKRHHDEYLELVRAERAALLGAKESA